MAAGCTALLLFSPCAGVALADARSSSFDPSIDHAGWYWQSAADDVTVDPLPAAPALPNPQSQDTLPVAMLKGSPEKASAVFVDLAARGVQGDVRLRRVVFTIREVSDQAEAPAFNAGAAAIHACRLVAPWGDAPAQPMQELPTYEPSTCVRGVRSGAPAAWTFDLTAMAVPWVRDSQANRGFLLIGASDPAPSAAAWQVNLKLPAPDDPATAANEYQATAGRVSIAVDFELVTPVQPKPTVAAAPLPTVPPGLTTPSDAGLAVASLPPAVTLPPAVAAVRSAVQQVKVRAPAGVWLLIPLGLLVALAVGWVIFEGDVRLLRAYAKQLLRGAPVLGFAELARVAERAQEASAPRHPPHTA